jgi:hypothetical protein
MVVVLAVLAPGAFANDARRLTGRIVTGRPGAARCRKPSPPDSSRLSTPQPEPASEAQVIDGPGTSFATGAKAASVDPATYRT